LLTSRLKGGVLKAKAKPERAERRLKGAVLTSEARKG
jgi:hypothetical protein